MRFIPFYLVLFLLCFPFSKLPRPFPALERALYLREQNTGQDLHHKEGAGRSAKRLGKWRHFSVTGEAERPGPHASFSLLSACQQPAGTTLLFVRRFTPLRSPARRPSASVPGRPAFEA